MTAIKTGHKIITEKGSISALLKCCVHFTVAFLLSRLNIQGQCQICAVAFVGASGGSIYGLFSLLGTIVGYTLFHGIAHTSLYIASALFIYTISYVMQFTRLYMHRAFGLGVVTIVLATVLSFGEISATRVQSTISQSFLLDILTGGMLSYIYSYGLRTDLPKLSENLYDYSQITLYVSLALSVSDFVLFQSVSLTKMLTLYAYLMASYLKPAPCAYIAALICGFGMQICFGSLKELCIYIIYSLYPIFVPNRSKIILSVYIAAVSAIFHIFTSSTYALSIQTVELIAPLVLYYISSDFIQKYSAQMEISVKKQIDDTKRRESVKLSFLSELLKDLSAMEEFSSKAENNDSNVRLIVDRICYDICLRCDQSSFCKNDYEVVKEQFLPYAEAQIAKRGKLDAMDLKDFYNGCCCNHGAIVMAINQALRLQYEQRLHKEAINNKIIQTHKVYAFTAELLQNTSKIIYPKNVIPHQAPQRKERFAVEIGVASLRKAGETVCGDTVRYFKNDRGILTIILSDGLGSGIDAMRQSEQTVELLEKLLYLTDTPSQAISLASIYLSAQNTKQLNNATIDMVTIDLYSGSIQFYKLGAADSYFTQNGKCTTIKASPANHRDVGQHLCNVHEHTCIVLCSDGINLSEETLEEMLHEDSARSMKQLAKNILIRFGEPKTDDCTALTIDIKRK